MISLHATKPPMLIDTLADRAEVVRAAVSQDLDEDINVEREYDESDHEAELPSPQVTEAPQNVKSPGTSTSISATFKSRLPKKRTKEDKLENTMSTVRKSTISTK